MLPSMLYPTIQLKTILIVQNASIATSLFDKQNFE